MLIQEIFYSFQGEGLFIGYPQIFIRFFGCTIACAYCDEPDFNREPHTVASVMQAVSAYRGRPLHSISFTGGEPLEQAEAIHALAPSLKAMFEKPLFLETNGILPEKLKLVLEDIDIFSVDFKPGYEKEFAAFMRLLSGRATVYVKYVMLHDFAMPPFLKMVDILAESDPGIPLILQPVTPFGTIKKRVTLEDIERGFTAAHSKLHDIRVIPQTHKWIGIQ